MFNLSTVANYAAAAREEALTGEAWRRYVEGLPGEGGMSPAQLEAHRLGDGDRLVIGGNQIGKTRWLAAETWFHATGWHPYREVPTPSSLGWILCADLANGWAPFSRKLREIEPPGVLSPSCTFDEATGYRYRGSRSIGLANGGLIVGKGSEQAISALSGDTIDYLIVDELPKRGHFGEARSRCAVREAPTMMGFTPIGRPAAWLRNRVDGDPDTGEPPAEEWGIVRVELTPENCPHRSPESIARQIAGYGPWEYQQRVKGAWDGVSEGRWVAFSEENLFEEIPTGIVALGLGWDHGERPGSSVCYLVGWDGNTLWVLDEYVSTDRITPAAEAQLVAEMIAGWGVTLHQIDVAYGDSNSAGRLGLGFKINDLLERGFAAVAKTKRPPFRIEVPYKGPGSVKARARLLSSACVEGRFRVNVSCTKLTASLKHWAGENSDYKHPYDAVSYIAEHWLDLSLLDSTAKLLL